MRPIARMALIAFLVSTVLGAVKIALKIVRCFLENHKLPEQLVFCVFDERNYRAYNRMPSEQGVISRMSSDSGDTVRVAILSDTHGCICPRVFDVVERCDVAVHAGDIGSANVLQMLHSGTGIVQAVRGNNDVPGLWAGDELDVVNALPRVAELQLPGGSLAVEHGHFHGPISPDHDKLRAAHPGARVIVYGHTHKIVIDRSESAWVVNPGAAGRIRNHGGPSCLVLTAGLRSWEIETYKFSS